MFLLIAWLGGADVPSSVTLGDIDIQGPLAGTEISVIEFESVRN